MLVRFEVSNFRSVAEPVELSLVAIDADRAAARRMEKLGESVLTRAAIFGPNASGKSNVLVALAWLVNAVRRSLFEWTDVIPVDPFAFGDWRDKPAEFTLDYVVDGVRFEYVLEVGQGRVHRESLYHYPKERSRTVFEREGQTVKFGPSMGSVAPVDELMTPTTLLLSLARRFKVPVASEFVDQLSSIQAFGNLPGQYGTVPGEPRWAEQTTDIFDVDAADHPLLFDHGEPEQALALLRLADLGISEVLVEHRDEPQPTHRDGTAVRSSSDLKARKVVNLVHEGDGEQVAFGLAEESQGTRMWYALIGPLVHALRKGGAILFDELDASLHPILTAELLRIFADEETNPRGAQLIFTTHDVSLLGHLNRDEVWLTEKRPDGSTELAALSEFDGKRVRQSLNLESGYLHGRFGAVPDINRASMLGALGLIG